MFSLAFNTYIHLLFIVVIFCCLVAELIFINNEISYVTIKKLTKIDGLYGLSAVVVVATGLLNWLKFGKGYEYYTNNTLFIVKFCLFILVGLLSLYPTILFLKTKKSFKDTQRGKMQLSHYHRIRQVIILELVIMGCIPLLAELMANGIDF